MVKHGTLSKSRMYELLRSKEARVRRAAFILLETSNPTLRRDSEVFLGLIRFIWDANPSYDIYREFTKRHLAVHIRFTSLSAPVLKWKNVNARGSLRMSASEIALSIRGDFSSDCFGHGALHAHER